MRRNKIMQGARLSELMFQRLELMFQRLELVQDEVIYMVRGPSKG